MRSVVLLLALTARAQAQPADMPRLTLREAIDRALRDNPRVLDQAQELERAHAQTEQTRAAGLPTLTGNGLYTRYSYQLSADGIVVQEPNAVSANITAALPLLAPRA